MYNFFMVLDLCCCLRLTLPLLHFCLWLNVCLICFIHKISVSNTNYAFYTQSMCFIRTKFWILEQLVRLKCAGCILYAVPLNFPLFFVYFFISVENDKVSVATYRLAAQLKPLLAKTAKLVKTQFEFRMDIIYHLILSDM